MMKSQQELFEIHITGDERIHIHAAKMGLKTIAVELLTPDKSVIRTEHMTSIRTTHKDIKTCRAYVKDIVEKLKPHTTIVRIKIETPYYEHYVNQSLYMESHFPVASYQVNGYPLSRNVKKTTFLGTDRTYNKDEFDQFRKHWEKAEVELCLDDSYVDEDLDWFTAWNK